MTDDLQNQIITKLSDLGFVTEEKDLPLINECYEKAESYFKTFCHIKTIPENLMPYLKDHCCGLFIKNKTMQNQIGTNFIHSAKIGDVNLTFDDKISNSQAVIESLFCPKEVLMCYRKMIW